MIEDPIAHLTIDRLKCAVVGRDVAYGQFTILDSVMALTVYGSLGKNI